MPEPVSRAANSSVDNSQPITPVLQRSEEYSDFGSNSSAVVRQATPGESSMESHQNPYILLITDDRVFGEHVTHALDRLHYRTAMLYTADPAVAISRCAAERPDLVMLNIDSLSLGGIGLSRRLKADSPELKVLSLVHGHELEAAQREAEVSGSDSVCGLLDLPMQIEAIVRELLERRIEEKEAAVPEPAMTLQDRIRAEASIFDFSALLDGVRTESELSSESIVAATAPISEPGDPAATSNQTPPQLGAGRQGPGSATPPELGAGGQGPRAEFSRPIPIVRKRARRPAKPVLVAILGLAAVAAPVFLLNSGVLQSNSEVGAGQGVPLKPDINLTVRKGLPFPPITPGERIPAGGPNYWLEAPITEEVKQKVFSAYGIGPVDAQSYVIIRLIPVELGGTENPANLFPTTPWFQSLKSRLDQRLIELVKGGRLTLLQAEAELKDNWVRAAHRYYVRNYGIDDPDKARQKEDELKWE